MYDYNNWYTSPSQQFSFDFSPCICQYSRSERIDGSLHWDNVTMCSVNKVIGRTGKEMWGLEEKLTGCLAIQQPNTKQFQAIYLKGLNSKKKEKFKMISSNFEVMEWQRYFTYAL